MFRVKFQPLKSSISNYKPSASNYYFLINMCVIVFLINSFEIHKIFQIELE